MLKGIPFVIVWTEDVQRLVPFYRDTLGLAPEMETPEFVSFKSDGGAQMAIGQHSEVRGKSSDPLRVMVNFQVDDCREEYERLAGKGVEFIRAASEDQGGSILATFLDPDGNTLQLFQQTSA
ncbi:MAG: VOC family protein [Dehalococcoidia bacterium]